MSVHVGASWWIRLNDQWRWKCGSLSTLCSRHFSFTASIQTWHSFEVCAQKYLVPWPVSSCADKTLTSFRSLRIMTCVLLCRQDINLVLVPSYRDLHHLCVYPQPPFLSSSHKASKVDHFPFYLIVLWEIIGVSSYINVDCRLVCFRVQRILVLQDVDWRNDVELIYWFGVFVVIHILCSCEGVSIDSVL